MTQWLHAAKHSLARLTIPTKPTEPLPSAPAPEVLSVKSVLSEGDNQFLYPQPEPSGCIQTWAVILTFCAHVARTPIGPLRLRWVGCNACMAGRGVAAGKWVDLL